MATPRVKKKRGFALLSAERQREIAIAGGRAAQQSGKAHRWTRKTAQEAGRKGGRNRTKQ